jgi:hypothetical protein
VVKTVRTSGGDYTTFASAVAGEVGDLVTLTRNLTIDCQTGADTTAVNITGFVTNATYFLTVKGNAGYTLSVSNNTAVTVNSNFTVIDGMNISLSSMSANYQRCVYFAGAASGNIHELKNCILKGFASATYRSRIVECSSSRTVEISNCVMYGATGAQASLANACLCNTADTVYLYDCTIYGAYNSLYLTGGTTVCKGNIFAPSNIVGTGTLTGSNYNATTKAVCTGGANDRVNQTFTFTDATNGNFLLTSGDTGARTFGVDLSADANYPVSKDITGYTRTYPTDIGAYQIQSGTTYGAELYRYESGVWTKYKAYEYIGSAFTATGVETYEYISGAWKLVDTTGL